MPKEKRMLCRYPRALKIESEKIRVGWMHTDNNISGNDAEYITQSRLPNLFVCTGQLNLASASVSITTTHLNNNFRYSLTRKNPWSITPKYRDVPTIAMTPQEYAEVFTQAMEDLGCSLGIFPRDVFSRKIEEAAVACYPSANILRLLPLVGGRVFITVNEVPMVGYCGGVLYVVFSANMATLVGNEVNYESLFRKITEQFLTREQDVPKRKEFTDDITIGLDPELEGYFVDKDGPDFDAQCVAAHYIPDGGGRVGCDGHSDIFELRPKQNKDPQKVVDNLQNCFNILGYTLSGISKEVFLLAGGGIIDSVGGHIHVGGTFFQEIKGEDISQFFGRIMDDFVYWPMRDTMPGAMRAWGNHPDMARRSRGNRECGFSDKRPAIIFTKIKGASRPRTTTFAGYEAPNSFRWTNYGFEYRSLPSFIVSPDLSKVVLTMARTVAKKMLDCYTEQKDFEYQCPPKKDDYLALFPEPLYHQFMRYINGNLNDIFLTNTLANWGVDTKSYEPVIKITGNHPDARIKNGIELTTQLRPLMKGLRARFKALHNLRSINVSIMQSCAGMDCYTIRSSKLAYTTPEDKMYVVGRNAEPSIGGIQKVSVSTEPDTWSFTHGISEAITLGLCDAIGERHFHNILKEVKEKLVTYEPEVTEKRFIYTFDELKPNPAEHAIKEFNSERLDEELEAIANDEIRCSSDTVVHGCNCLRCTALRNYREDTCENCDNFSCSFYSEYQDRMRDEDESEAY